MSQALKKRQASKLEVVVPLEIAAQMDAAADAALDYGLTAMRAKEMFMYTFLSRAVQRNGNNQSKAAAKLGTSRQHVNDSLQRLEVRLAR